MSAGSAGPGGAEALAARLDDVARYRRLPWRKKLASRPGETLFNSAASRLLRLLGRLGLSVRKEAETFFGGRMTVLLPSGYNEIFLHGAAVDSDAEVRLTMFLLRHLREGAVFFDVGACLGYYSLLGASLVGRGEVHAFEPAAPLLPILRRNLAGRPNIRLVEKALSDKPGTARLFIAPLPHIGTSSLRGDWQERSLQAVEVETLRLDDYADAAGAAPDIVKLDVEGVEERVLRGAERLLRGKGPLLAMEVFTPLLESDRRAVELLESFGYGPCAIRGDGSLRPLGRGELEPYLAEVRARYRVVQDAVNDFDNLVFRRQGP